MTDTKENTIRRDLKPNLKFDYVPIKEVNIGGTPEQKDWLRTDTFIDIVSKLLKEEDVQRAGGFMVIRPKNDIQSQPFLYPKDHNHSNYNPKQYDMHHTMNAFGVQNLKTYYQAQIHDQTCKEVKSQIWKWSNDEIYHNQQTVAQQFETNQSNLQKRKAAAQNKRKSLAKKQKKKKKKKTDLPFDVIMNNNGERITQTQSGRIVKVYSQTHGSYAQLDAYLDGKPTEQPSSSEEEDTSTDSVDYAPDHDMDRNDQRKRKRIGSPSLSPTKKRKLSETEEPQIQIHPDGVFTMDYQDTSGHATNNTKYQYPFQLAPAMPEPGVDSDHTNDYQLQTRQPYTQMECKTDNDVMNHRMPSPSVSSRSSSPNKRATPAMDVRRGFACVIEQIERRKKKSIGTFWDKKKFETQLNENVYCNATPEEVPLIFCDYLESAEMVQYGIVDEETTYHFESPLQLSQLSRYGPFCALRQNEVMLGIELPYVYIGQEHAFFPFHREDMNLFAVNHVLWGCDKIWYCIHPEDHGKVLQFVREQYCTSNERLSKCETPLQHKLFWFDPYILLSMGIRVWYIRQRVGDIVVTPPGGIHGGLNAGPNMAESINFMTYDIEMCWKPVLSAMLYYCHNFQCDVCITHAFLDVNRLAMRLREKEEDGVPDATVIYEALPISQTFNHVPKYKNADKYISRSFTWNERLSLRSRYLHSNEYKEWSGALSKEMVYPYYVKSDGRVSVYPVRYNGHFTHRPDELIFEPLYNICYLDEEEKGSEDVRIKCVLKEYAVNCEDWDQSFDEKGIRLKLRSEQGQALHVVFVYQKRSVINSAERKRNKRVIVDSDTDSDDD